MVSYRDAEGKHCYHEVDALSDATTLVEHLRNDEAVDHARIFKLEEVTFEFRPYFRVEIADGAAPSSPEVGQGGWLAAAQEASAPDEDRDPLAAAWAASERSEDRADDSVGAGMGRRGLFGR